MSVASARGPGSSIGTRVLTSLSSFSRCPVPPTTCPTSFSYRSFFSSDPWSIVPSPNFSLSHLVFKLTNFWNEALDISEMSSVSYLAAGALATLFRQCLSRCRALSGKVISQARTQHSLWNNYLILYYLLQSHIVSYDNQFLMLS